MSLAKLTDKELLREADTFDWRARAQVKLYMREIIRLREALREVQQRAREADIMTKTGAACLEISARALDGSSS